MSIQLICFIFITSSPFYPKSLWCIIYAPKMIYWILLWHFNKIKSVQLKRASDHNIWWGWSNLCLCFNFKHVLICNAVINIHSDNERLTGFFTKCPYSGSQHMCPRPVLPHCPLSCLTLKVHEFLIINMVTVGILYWPSAIFSARLSQRSRRLGGK